MQRSTWLSKLSFCLNRGLCLHTILASKYIQQRLKNGKYGLMVQIASRNLKLSLLINQCYFKTKHLFIYQTVMKIYVYRQLR